MKKEINEVIGTFIGQTIIWVLCLLAIGLIAKIVYILIKFSWGLI
jgi:hypothetical protein